MSETILNLGEEGASPECLLVLRPTPPQSGLELAYVIESLPARIGRHSDNEVELCCDSISRFHARLEAVDGGFRLVDLGSSNGTWVNGERIETAEVHDQDLIGLGELQLALTIERVDASRAPTESSSQAMSVHLVPDNAEGLDEVHRAELPDSNADSHLSNIESDITSEKKGVQARRRLIGLYRLMDAMNHSETEREMLVETLKLLFDILPARRGVVLLRREDDPSSFRVMAIRTRDSPAHERIGVSRTILKQCLDEHLAILTRDATTDHRFNQAESILAARMRSVMCVPLVDADHVFGFINLDTDDSAHPFVQDDLSFLASVGSEVATHLNNLRLTHERIASERMAAIGQTITGMAHNIKNILLLSQGSMEVMDKRLQAQDIESATETWGVVERSIERINRLVHEMLDYARPRQVERRKARIGRLLRRLHESFADSLAQCGVDCRVETPEDDPEYLLDVDGLEKALANLLVNAIEACEDESGEITLRAYWVARGRHICIEVHDTGGGIPEDVRPRLFLPFVTTKGSKGSGLGLATTRKYIEDMGGRIELKSSDAQGSCFAITLPVRSSTVRDVREIDSEGGVDS